MHVFIGLFSGCRKSTYLRGSFVKRLLGGCRDELEPLIAVLLGAEDVDSVRPQAAHDMMADRTGSHVLEVNTWEQLHGTRGDMA